MKKKQKYFNPPKRKKQQKLLALSQIKSTTSIQTIPNPLPQPIILTRSSINKNKNNNNTDTIQSNPSSNPVVQSIILTNSDINNTKTVSTNPLETVLNDLPNSLAKPVVTGRILKIPLEEWKLSCPILPDNGNRVRMEDNMKLLVQFKEEKLIKLGTKRMILFPEEGTKSCKDRLLTNFPAVFCVLFETVGAFALNTFSTSEMCEMVEQASTLSIQMIKKEFLEKIKEKDKEISHLKEQLNTRAMQIIENPELSEDEKREQPG